jgi:Na+/proline symporter/serine phosphatase RsbU (regulator of sigma subunit)
MIRVEIVAFFSFLYFGLLFAVAYFADKRREAGRSITSNSLIYALSLAVLFTSWTVYGSIGRAATHGVEVFSSYIGVHLIICLGWVLLRRIVRISKEQNIVSIADFISSRYGKSALLGKIVTVIAVIGISPYIALQLKAVAYTFDILSPPEPAGWEHGKNLISLLLHAIDPALIVALLLSLFSIIFGARNLASSERHEGLVAAIALGSVVKLAALLTLGIFVTYGLFDGFADIFARFTVQFPDRSNLFLLGTPEAPYHQWFSLIFIQVITVMFLPRMFHIMVVENTNEEHIKSALWIFNLYIFLTVLFFLPVALGGILLNNGDITNAEFFALQIPLQSGQPWLAILVFIGGFSAAAGMVMVESVAISTMILNHLVMPVILKLKIKTSDLSILLLNIKRFGIVAVIFIGYLTHHLMGASLSLVNIGLVSFVAIAQFAPATIGGLFWKGATRSGATAGLMLGFIVWCYTLVIPSFILAGWFKSNLLADGLFGIGLLRPLELFGLSGIDMLSHSIFWTLFFNAGAYVIISLCSVPSESEAEQAVKFVDIFASYEAPVPRQRLSKGPTVIEFKDLMAKFIGQAPALEAIVQFLSDQEIDEQGSLSEYELPMLKRFVERTLSGSVGDVAAGVITESYLAARGSHMEDVFDIFGRVSLSRTASREQLSILYEAAREVTSGADLQTIQDNILELLRQQFPLDLCLIRILDESRMVLTVRSQKGKYWSQKESEREPDMETYAGAAFVTNAAVVVNDTELMDKPISIRAVHPKGIKSFAHAPIAIEGKPIGVLSAFSESAKGIFTDEFIELFQSLASQIGIAWRNANQTVKLIEAKEQERELQIARTIQLTLLPNDSPDILGISLAGKCVPSRVIGGDYYDFLHLGKNALDLLIADVSGHNVGTALFMAEVRTFIQASEKCILRPGDILSALNEFLYEDLTRAELFITMFYLKFNAVSRNLSFANAGHNRPMVWRKDALSCEWLDAEGLILGVKRGVKFEEREMNLREGDILLLYTDGITEAADADGVFFGEERLCTMLQDCHSLPPQQIIENLLREVRAFTGSESFVDDVSIVVMKVEELR